MFADSLDHGGQRLGVPHDYVMDGITLGMYGEQNYHAYALCDEFDGHTL